MKLMTFLSGAIFAFLSSTGFFLKALSWSLGDPFLTVGIGGFVLVFIPLLLLLYLRTFQMMMTYHRMLFLLGVGSLTLVGAGFVLKVNHIYGANLAIGIGGVLLSCGFIPALFYGLYRNAPE